MNRKKEKKSYPKFIDCECFVSLMKEDACRLYIQKRFATIIFLKEEQSEREKEQER
jgi:hypothetical protein